MSDIQNKNLKTVAVMMYKVEKVFAPKILEQFRDHSCSTYVKFSEKVTFFTP